MKPLLFIITLLNLVVLGDTLRFDCQRIIPHNDTSDHEQVRWINFTIKNNSENRNHFVVKGPKLDGSKFGYGFPMMPNEEREERWSVGTKIYKENKLGFRKLLVTIKSKDENTIVNLFN